MEPAISIIVPVYNIEHYISKCLDSIIAQAFSDFEVILVNDGSTDGSGKICDLYAEKDKRIRTIHKQNGGVSSSRNAGIKIAQGKYIAFVDGDDWIDKNLYKELYRLCLETGSDISICRFGREINGELIKSDEKKYILEMDNSEAIRQLFRGELYRFSLCNKLFKKSCFDKILFPEGRIHEDLSTTYRLFANSSKAVFTAYTGYIYVKRENSILTSKFSEKRLDALIGWDEILTFMKQNYPQLSTEFISCFAYGCLDNVFYVLNQIEEQQQKEKYLAVIRQYVRKYYRDILVNRALHLKSKYIITLLNCHIGLLLVSCSLKKAFNRGF